MQIQYTGSNIEITNAIRELAEKKMERINSHFNNINNAHFTFKVNNKESHEVKLTLNISGATLHAEDESNDLYKSIDTVIEKIKAQIIKYKEKHQEYHHR